ncbi:hypothetical protein HP1_132 [Candidatus Termititenax spirochaetophilus]|uniref:Uncharacterized protein n=1 Tax=Candidatus Termititenax spirochaetophilus TaxID=2218522 RepID=A0A388T717_9BACT|nr:hypothetical protein HP1_132 [Candidatus Termititenax spirochaetophilus]
MSSPAINVLPEEDKDKEEVNKQFVIAAAGVISSYAEKMEDAAKFLLHRIGYSGR